MKEVTDILQAIEQTAPGTPMALATVVRVQGSAYRRPGARMLIIGDGHTVGGVSGGCLERDVVRRATAIMHSNQPALVRYDTTLDAEEGSGFSLGCGGAIDILIESLSTPAGSELLACLKLTRTSRQAIATVISRRHPSIPLASRIRIDDSGQIEGLVASNAFSKAIAEDAVKAMDAPMGIGLSRFMQYPTAQGEVDLFIEIIVPPLNLMIFGAGSDALPLTEFAKALGWKVTIVDVRSAPLDPQRVWSTDQLIRCSIERVRERVEVPSSSAAVVMTHNFSHDRQLIAWLTTEPLAYLGLLGPRHRTEQVVAGLEINHLHSPAGLDIGADNPQEVALAIVAEITAVLRGRSGHSLRSTEGPIHVGNPVPDPKALLRSDCLLENSACPVAAS